VALLTYQFCRAASRWCVSGSAFSLCCGSATDFLLWCESGPQPTFHWRWSGSGSGSCSS